MDDSLKTGIQQYHLYAVLSTYFIFAQILLQLQN